MKVLDESNPRQIAQDILEIIQIFKQGIRNHDNLHKCRLQISSF